MNDKNLIPLTKRTPREQKQISSKGGKRSAEVKKEKKLLKDLLQTILEMKDHEGVDNQTLITLALTEKAKMGDTKAFEVIRDTLGQKPKDQVELEGKITYEDALKKAEGEHEY